MTMNDNIKTGSTIKTVKRGECIVLQHPSCNLDGVVSLYVQNVITRKCYIVLMSECI